MTFLFFFLFLSNNSNKYQLAEANVDAILSQAHDDRDSVTYCDGKLRSLLLRDSILNRPGAVGTEYNYPLYKFETEIIFYEGGKIASVERRIVTLKRYSVGGITTGIQITKIPDPLNTFYFGQDQQTVSETELIKIEKRICKEK